MYVRFYASMTTFSGKKISLFEIVVSLITTFSVCGKKKSMIIMGTTGKDRFKEFWFGSVSHRVAEELELPVLLVP